MVVAALVVKLTVPADDGVVMVDCASHWTFCMGGEESSCGTGWEYPLSAPTDGMIVSIAFEVDISYWRRELAVIDGFTMMDVSFNYG